eukprot:1138743-Pelagomonas_calceolata.AAC.1
MLESLLYGLGVGLELAEQGLADSRVVALGRSDVLTWVQAAYLMIIQVVMKGLPSRLAQGKVVSAGIILNSLVFGNGTCASISRNSSLRFHLRSCRDE